MISLNTFRKNTKTSLSYRKNILINSLYKVQESLENFGEVLLLKKKKRWINRKWLVRPYFRNRQTRGFFNVSFQEIKGDKDLFFKCTRMDVAT